MSLTGQLCRLGTGLYPIRRVVVLMQFKLWLDEAGHQLDQPAFALGGLIGDVSAWEELVPRWKHNLGEVSLFHATDFAASHGAFEGWEVGRKQELLDKLL